MKKLVLCLSAFFCVVFGTAAVLTLKADGIVKRYEKNVEPKIVIVVDEGEEKEEAAKAIQEKVGGEILKTLNMTSEEMEERIKGASLVLFGTEKWDKIIEKMQGEVKVSFFYLGGREEDLLWLENQLEQKIETGEMEKQGNLKLVPGLWLTWEEEVREKELSYMDGWLTTAFTY